jgi:hypothetical protein
VVAPPPPGTVLGGGVFPCANGTDHGLVPFPWVPGTTVVPVGSLCVVVQWWFFGLDLVVDPPLAERLEGVVGGSSCTKWNFPVGWSTFSTVWNHVVPVGSLCVVFCGDGFFGLDQVVGPPTTWNGLGRWWRSLLPKWNYSSWLVHLFLGLESLEPYWCLLEHFVVLLCVWCSFGLDLVVGPTPPPGDGLGRWWRLFSCTKWNFIMVGQPFLGLGVTGTMLVPVGSLCVVLWP